MTQLCVYTHAHRCTNFGTDARIRLYYGTVVAIGLGMLPPIATPIARHFEAAPTKGNQHQNDPCSVDSEMNRRITWAGA